MKSLIRPLALAIATVIALHLGLSPSAHAVQIYWTQPDGVYRSNLDGTNAVQLIRGLEYGFALAVDLPGGKLYWTDLLQRKVQRADLDGMNMEDLATSLGLPIDVAVDPVGKHVYWIGRFDEIYRAKLDGTDPELIASVPNVPTNLAIDLVHRQLYWTEDDNRALVRSELDGSNQETILGGTRYPNGLMVRPDGSAVYASIGNNIWRVRTDTLDAEVLVAGGDFFSPGPLSWNESYERLYWVNENALSIGLEFLLDGNIHVLRPGFYPLDFVVVPTPVPEPNGIALAAISVMSLSVASLKRHRSRTIALLVQNHVERLDRNLTQSESVT